jgi:deoxyribonuclease IV
MNRRTPAGLPPIGAHVSTAGGLPAILERALHLGVDAIQMFNTNPRTWRVHRYPPIELDEFGTRLEEHRIRLFIHAIYLINLATPDEALRLRSLEALVEALVFGAQTGAEGVVVHVGSHRGSGFEVGASRVIDLVGEARRTAAAAVHTTTPAAPAEPGTAAPGPHRALAETGLSPPLPPLLLENSPGAGRSLGRSLEELACLREAIGGTSGVCLDSAHLFAAGFPVHTPAGLRQLVGRLAGLELLDHVRLIHLNDCKSALGSLSDRHANLGEGALGMAGLTGIVREPAFRSIPFVLEVPGEDGHGPDLVNVRRAKSMRPEARVRQEPPARRAER